MASEPPPSASSSSSAPAPSQAARSADAVDHQDPSIKVRKSQLYEQPQPTAEVTAAKPFAEYLRATPPAPLSPGVKTALWVVGALIVLLFLAAVLFGHNPMTPRRRHADWPADRPAAVVLVSRWDGPGELEGPPGRPCPGSGSRLAH
jgi:hypothetical protein